MGRYKDYHNEPKRRGSNDEQGSDNHPFGSQQAIKGQARRMRQNLSKQ